MMSRRADRRPNHLSLQVTVQGEALQRWHTFTAERCLSGLGEPMMEEEDRRLEQLVRLYRAAREQMDALDDVAREQLIEYQFEQGNIVYGVWLDATKPHGIDYEVLKSSERLE